MVNTLRITSLEVCGNQIIGNFDVKGSEEWISFFSEPYVFDIRYDIDIKKVPKSIAVIPFVANILPIIWIGDGILQLDELDRNFYSCISNVKNGYQKMYPYINFRGNIIVNDLIENKYNKKNSSVLFSGGVDAFNTLLNNMDENPILITLWGADIDINNVNGWEPVKSHINTTAKKFGINRQFIKSNFRIYISENNLQTYIMKFNKNLGWWHDFQHGIAIICHTAPLAYLLEIEKVYIASSFTKDDIGNYTCASDPSIDNYVRFASTKAIHDGYEYNRQMKIENIVKYSKKSNIDIPLRVCWESKDGKNCCHCEKCYRTILAILAEKENPIRYGFENYNMDLRKRMIKELKYKYKVFFNFRYGSIQHRLREMYNYNECPDDLKWFYKMRIRNTFPIWYKILRKSKRIIYYLLHVISLHGDKT